MPPTQPTPRPRLHTPDHGDQTARRDPGWVSIRKAFDAERMRVETTVGSENPEDLVSAKQVMHLHRSTQTTVRRLDAVGESPAVTSDAPAPTGSPRIALLDGLPMANHDLLAGRLIIDGPGRGWSAWRQHPVRVGGHPGDRDRGGHRSARADERESARTGIVNERTTVTMNASLRENLRESVPPATCDG